jgi:hypothetical protein
MLLLCAAFYSESEHPGCPQSHEISTPPFASSQRWLQYCLSSATVHRHAGCAHFLGSILPIIILPFYQPVLGGKSAKSAVDLVTWQSDPN